MASNKIKLGNYVLGETLGVGSFGKVKLAEHEPTGIKVAIKILNRNKVAHMDMQQKVRREIQYLRVLKHPHVIRLYEVINTPTDIFLVMEYVASGELFDYIVKKGRLQEEEARKFFQQIVCAVEYCHRRNIVHRDLKPENLLLDSHCNVRIADFGLSNVIADGEFLKTSCGSPNYAAPEVISGKLYAGPEVDVWSCGVILYALLCGKLPFDDEFIPNLFHKIKHGDYSIPAYVPDDARTLIEQMLIVDPLKRITLPDIRQQPWFQEKLPDYLRQLTISDNTQEPINTLVVDELAKRLQLDSRFVVRSLVSDGEDVMKVSYALVFDHLRQSLDVKNMMLLLEPTFMLRPSMSLDFEKEKSLEPPPHRSSISILGSSLPPQDGIHSVLPREIQMLPVNTNHNEQQQQQLPPQQHSLNLKKRSRWHLGIRSSSRPEDVMFEVFRALKNVGMDWRIHDKYHVIGRLKGVTGKTVKVNLQLYKVDARSYILDFKSVKDNGELACFNFFDVCFKLITELAIAS